MIPTDYTITPFTVEQYHAMAAAGILEEGAPIELLEGYLAGIVSYWIVNLVDRYVEVYTMPSGNTLHPTYRNQQSFGEDDSLELVIDGEVVGRLAVRSILP